MSYMRTDWEKRMPYYRVVGEIPRKRHVQFRRPDGGLYAEELMGEEGFTSDSSLLYHRHLPTAIIKAEAVTATGARPAPTCRSPPATSVPRTSPTGGDLVAGRGAAGQRRRPHVVRRAEAPASSTATPWATSASTSHRPGQVRVDLGVIEAGEGDYVVIPTGRSTAGCLRAASRPSPSRRRDTSGRPSATCPVRASSWSTRPTASATCAPRGSLCSSRARSAGAGPHARRADPAGLPQPPVRRGRLGRLPLSLRVQHRRLRAHR